MLRITCIKASQFSMFSEFRSFKEMVGITVAEPIVPIYLDRAALRKLKMQDGKDIQYFIREMNIFTPKSEL